LTAGLDAIKAERGRKKRTPARLAVILIVFLMRAAASGPYSPSMVGARDYFQFSPGASL